MMSIINYIVISFRGLRKRVNRGGLLFSLQIPFRRKSESFGNFYLPPTQTNTGTGSYASPSWKHQTY